MYKHVQQISGLDVGYFDVHESLNHNQITECQAHDETPKIRLSTGPHDKPEKYWWFSYEDLLHLLEAAELAARRSADTFRAAGIEPYRR